MLETSILDQVRSVFQHLEARYIFHITYNPEHEQAQEFIGFLNNVASCSEKLSCLLTETDNPGLEFTLLKEGVETGIKFRGIPSGHEFTSLLLAVLNADGKGKNLPDEAISRRIKALQGPVRLQTYVSLTCTNCPDVVQALNIITLLNPQITHEMVDGALYQEEVDALKIQGVPSVYANGKLLHVVGVRSANCCKSWNRPSVALRKRTKHPYKENSTYWCSEAVLPELPLPSTQPVKDCGLPSLPSVSVGR